MTETTMTAENLFRYLRQIGGKTIDYTGAFIEDYDDDKPNTFVIAPDGVYIKFATGNARYVAIEMIYPTMYGLLSRTVSPRRLMKGRELILVDTRDEPSEAVVVEKIVYQTMINAIDMLADLAEDFGRRIIDPSDRDLLLSIHQSARDFLNSNGMKPTSFDEEE